MVSLLRDNKSKVGAQVEEYCLPILNMWKRYACSTNAIILSSIISMAIHGYWGQCIKSINFCLRFRHIVLVCTRDRKKTISNISCLSYVIPIPLGVPKWSPRFTATKQNGTFFSLNCYTVQIQTY